VHHAYIMQIHHATASHSSNSSNGADNVSNRVS